MVPWLSSIALAAFRAYHVLDYINYMTRYLYIPKYISSKALNGIIVGIAAGALVSEATQCLTDTFSITNQENLPVICGINSGYHVYFGTFHLPYHSCFKPYSNLRCSSFSFLIP